MKRRAGLIVTVVLLLVAAIYAGKPGRNDVQAQGGGAETYSLPLVMRMPTLTPTATPTPPPSEPPNIIRVSIASDGTQANQDSLSSRISADGRYITFYSKANNLVSNDTNNRYDVFLHDAANSVTTRVSLSSDGAEGNHDSGLPDISADGRFIAFYSHATNLVAGDTTFNWDIFVHNRESGSTERVSLTSSGAQANNDSYPPTISADGRYVAFSSAATNLYPFDSNGLPDVFLRDRQTGQTEYVPVPQSGSGQADGSSLNPYVSGDGRYVAFESFARNLVPGDTNMKYDVYVRDRLSGTNRRPSSTASGAAANDESRTSGTSADGRYILFVSTATDLVPGDSNQASDVFLYDQQTQSITRVSVGSGGVEANGLSRSAAISADGRYVVFSSQATNLVPHDTNGVEDAFLRDLHTGIVTRLSIALDGSQANDISWPTAISATGRYILLESLATNLVPGDTNGVSDVFLYDRTPPAR